MNEAEDKLAASMEKPEERRESAREIRVGDTVEIRSMGIKADVISIGPDRVLQLQAGIMKVSAREDEVLLIEKNVKEKKSVAEKSAAALRSFSVSPEVDLRGMMVDEALLAMERYLDSAMMAKLKTVTIIHGKGTGALRQAVQNELKRNRYVKNYRLGRYGEGEMGVTVVELR